MYILTSSWSLFHMFRQYSTTSSRQWSDNKQTNKREAHEEQRHWTFTCRWNQRCESSARLLAADSLMVLSGFWLVPVSPPPESLTEVTTWSPDLICRVTFITLTSDWLYVLCLVCCCVMHVVCVVVCCVLCVVVCLPSSHSFSLLQWLQVSGARR